MVHDGLGTVQIALVLNPISLRTPVSADTLSVGRSHPSIGATAYAGASITGQGEGDKVRAKGRPGVAPARHGLSTHLSSQRHAEQPPSLPCASAPSPYARAARAACAPAPAVRVSVAHRHHPSASRPQAESPRQRPMRHRSLKQRRRPARRRQQRPRPERPRPAHPPLDPPLVALAAATQTVEMEGDDESPQPDTQVANENV